MDLQRQSAAATQATLQQLKAKLKQWENDFRTQHSRPPSKGDVQACSSIQQMYRDYAQLKKKLEKRNPPTEEKIHVKSHPRELVSEVVTNSEVAPLDRSRLSPAHPAAPSDDSSGSHISSTPPKPVSVKRELQPCGMASSTTGARIPLQSLSPNLCNIAPAHLNSNTVPSIQKIECGSLKRKAASKTATGAPQKPSPQPVNGLCSLAAAPDQKDSLAACPLALEGLVIKLQRHGSLLNCLRGSLPDDPFPAGFFSRSGPSSLVRKDVEAYRTNSIQTEAIRDDIHANVDPVTIVSTTGDKYLKEDRFDGMAGQAGSIVDQSQCLGLTPDTPISTPFTAVGSGCSATLSCDDVTDSVENVEDERRKKVGDRGDLSLDLQKETIVGLKKMLQEQGLPLTGNKSSLIHRLEEMLPTRKQVGQLSTSDDIGQAHEVTTCATPIMSLKRRVDDRDHELCPEDICNGENGKSLNRTRKYSLRSKGLPSGQQPEIETGGISCVIVTPEKSSAGECPNVPPVKASKKRAKASEALEENSWANPQALRKRARSQKGRSQAPSKSRQSLCARPGERDNFVRLNINGKGGKGRRFVNGTRTKRPGAYGRRGTHGAKFRKRGTKNAAIGVLEHEGNKNGDCEPARNCVEDRSSSLWVNDGWIETASSPEGLAYNNGTSTEKLDPRLNDIVEKAQKKPSDENLLQLLQVVFRFNTFRTGQLEAIKRILALQSTMVTLPTGAGKSLCYQLPAHLLPGITLVISPLIALMTDQLSHLPLSLPGALISSAQTSQESSATISRLRAGQVKVLFISPERLFSESFLSVLGELPKISLAVIDEAHCLSEWSHNFRPSYFRLGKVLHQRMKVSCLLALTATATKKAEESIMKSLSIPAAGVVQAFHLRQNLSLSVSRETNRLQSLLSLLQSKPYAEAKSIIIYCTFQVETDYISGFLDQNGIQAKSYHGKKTSQERNRIYELFCRNKLRVVVATVAFGMGLDKSDVRAIVHYNMPRSLEHYVQETGRAGRDGNPAYCHLFLDDVDYLKLRSLAYSDGVDEYSVNKFLCRVFTKSSASTKPGYLVSIIIDTASRELDMKEEVMETILSLLEVGDVEYVKVLSKLNATCTLSFHQSRPASLAARNTFVAAIINGSKEKQGRFVFDLPSIATQLQWSLFQVQSELRRLQVAGEITYEVGDSALCFSVLEIPVDICVLTSKITQRLAEVEQCQVRKIDTMHSAASAAVRDMNWAAQQEIDVAISAQQVSLQSCIKSYFEGEDLPFCTNVPTLIKSDRSFVRADIKVFLKSARNPNMTGRAVARIFHGLWSPAFPYSEWSKSHFWGQHSRVDFEIIKEVAAAETLLQHTTSRNDFQL